MKISVITHYPEDDTEFRGDYCEVTVAIDNTVVITYGDYYHDKGAEKAEGFTDAISALVEKNILTDVEWEFEDVADYELG